MNTAPYVLIESQLCSEAILLSNLRAPVGTKNRIKQTKWKDQAECEFEFLQLLDLPDCPPSRGPSVSGAQGSKGGVEL